MRINRRWRASGVFAVGAALLIGLAPSAYSASAGPGVTTPAKDNPGASVTGRVPNVASAPRWEAGPTLRPRLSMPVRALAPTRTAALAVPLTTGTSTFEGLGNTAGRLPANPDVAASDTAVFEVANPNFQIFSTSGVALTGPASTSQLWAPLGGSCATLINGDWSQVIFDEMAGRFVYAMTVHPVTGTRTDSLECLAVSQTSDPTGAYYLYAVPIAQGSPYSDYPQFAVWSDAYYVAANLWTGHGGSGKFVADRLIAVDRAAMLAGQPVRTIRATLGSAYETFVPTTVEGATPPPAGSPEFLLGGPNDFKTNGSSIQMFTAHINFSTPSASSLTGPVTIPVSPYNLKACSTSPGCARQPGTTVKLQAWTDNLMPPVGYRNFGSYQSIVGSFGVNAGGTDGLQWFELRNPLPPTQVYQQGVYAPDSSARYVGSMAMDGSGDIALAYSLSSASIYPSLAYTGRAATDPLGALTAPEQIMWAGSGSQTGAPRWGDASYLAIAPDGCTFWYANTYYPTTSASGWHTRIGSFQYPGCQPGGGS